MTSVPDPVRASREEEGAPQISMDPEAGTPQWRPRDFLAAALLFASTGAFVLWQNSRVAVLWDLGYLLDTSWRIALGQVPYRDFPFAHAPLTFLIQAGLIRLGGRHYLVTVAYAAAAGGLASVLTWRILLRVMRGAGWWMALVMAAPLPVLGIYSVYPHPIYDCDCTMAVLVAVLLLMAGAPSAEAGAKALTSSAVALARLKSCPVTKHGTGGVFPQPLTSWPNNSRQPTLAAKDAAKVGHPVSWIAGRRAVMRHGIAVAGGAAAVLPLFFKQNIGLAFLAAIGAGMLVLMGAAWRRTHSIATVMRSQPAMAMGGIALALVVCVSIVAVTAGLGNYIHWTIQFAAQRRLPGLGSMLSVYKPGSLVWAAPALGSGLILCYTRLIQRWWGQVAAFLLIAAPFVGSLVFLLIDDDMEDRADSLLALWPLLLLAALIIALFELRRGITLGRLIPFFVLAAIHGAFLSQQLWGSTYAMWPLLMVLAAGLLAVLPGAARRVALGSVTVIAVTFLMCGGLYAISLDRLLYTRNFDAPVQRSSVPALRGMATPGPFLPNLDELVRFAANEIPQSDALLLLPGEDPFYYASGRTPRFPVTLFDPATDPYSATGLMEEAQRREVRWVIVKRVLQIDENPMPEGDQAMELVQRDFVLYRRLRGYDVYRRR